MKKTKSRVFFVLVTLTLVAQSQPAPKTSVAIYPLKAAGAADMNLASALTSLLSSELTPCPALKLIEDSMLKEVMARQVQSESDAFDDTSSQVEIGKLVKAQKMITGDLVKLGSRYILTLKLTDIQTGTLDLSTKDECACPDETVDQLVAVAGKKVRNHFGEGVAIPAVPQASGTQAATLAQAVSGTKGGPMVFVKAGKFWMGCNGKVDNECNSDEKSKKKMEVESFWIDQTEVTVAEYKRCAEAGTCRAQGLNQPSWEGKDQTEWAWACNWGQSGRENHPINCLNWDQAKGYCEWAGKRLPNEAEWEKAARGTGGWKYPWGNEGYASGTKVANIADETAKKQFPDWPVAVGYDDGYVGTAPVGTFPAGMSPYGALDMIGNVWEWTSDWYSEENKTRAARGGSWRALPKRARASYRGGHDPGVRHMLIGVRCAK